MSVELIIDPNEAGEGEGFELAPNHAWREVAAWALGRAKEFPALARLTASRRVPAGALRDDLAKIGDETPEDLIAVRDALTALLAGMADDTLVAVD